MYLKLPSTTKARSIPVASFRSDIILSFSSLSIFPIEQGSDKTTRLHFGIKKTFDIFTTRFLKFDFIQHIKGIIIVVVNDFISTP